jgi:hypothetical protein
MRRLATCALCAAAATAALIPIPARAQSCTPFLGNLQTWLETKPNGPGTYEIAFTMVSSLSDGKYVSYAEGIQGTKAVLKYYAGHYVGGVWVPPYLQGDVTQYFTDRRYAPSGTGLTWAPFDPFATDQAEVTINLSPLGSSFAKVILTLLSWGNTEFGFQGLCHDGLMYGFVHWPGPDQSANTMIVMSLNESYTPPIN